VSGSSQASLPVYNITVGTAGTFTNEASTDVSAQVNAEIAAAPAGDHIVVTFEPGDYGASGPIKLPSNASVVGNDSTLTYLPTAGAPQNFGLIVNASAYTEGGQTFVQNADGTTAPLNFNIFTNTQVMTGSGDVVDSNISVQGMTFALGNAHMFGTWFTNAKNVDVQNNTYIGGTDGNAFVDVVNGVVAQNIALGQNNGAYDNWDGPSNISIDNNASYMSGTSNTGWSVLLNSCPTGNPNNPGNAVNDSVVGNQFASGYANALAIDANALLSYGATSEQNITVQDNIDSLLGITGQSEIGSSGPMLNLIVKENMISGLAYTAGATGYEAAIGIFYNGVPNTTVGDQVLGNLITGANSQSGQASIQNDSKNGATENNAIIGANNATAGYTYGNGVNGTMTVAGNINNNAGTTTGIGVIPTLNLATPGGLVAQAGVTQAVPDLSVQDTTPGDILGVTLLVHFGSLSVAGGQPGVTATSYNGETGLILNGSAAQIDKDLAALSFTSNAYGWDDSLGITVTSAAGDSAISFVPITVDSAQSQTYGGAITLSAAYLSQIGLGAMTNFGTLDGANLTGGAILAESGNNTLVMGSSISLAFLGTGTNLVEGGSQDEYITTGEGSAAINLFLGGDVTIAGGTGALTVNAATGDNLIQSGTGETTVQAGAGANTITGNTGVLNVTGGAGNLLIDTLPEGGGTLNAQLGTGNAVVFALSGQASIATQATTSNLIDTGIGVTTITSGGNDQIYLGAGADFINALSGAADTIIGQGYGQAAITVAAGDSLVLAGVFSAADTVNFSGGHNVVTLANPYDFDSGEIGLLGGELTLNGLKAGDTIDLSGFNAVAETYVAGVGLVLADQYDDQITLDITGNFLTHQFSLATDGAGTQIDLGLQSSIISASIDTFDLVGSFNMLVGGTIAAETVGAAVFDGANAALTVNKGTRIIGQTSEQYGAGIALNGPGFITNSGTITGSAGIEVFGAAAGSYITNRSAVDATLSAGIYLQGNGSAINTGHITAQTAGLLLGAGGYGYNRGAIDAHTGIEILGGAGNYAVNVGTINATTGILLGGASNDYALNTRVINASQDGIALLAGGVAYNYGKINAGQDGILLTNGAVAYNYGHISGAYGVSLQSGSDVFNSAGITGTSAGITASGPVLIDNYQFGTIAGGAYGVILTNGGTLIDSGHISGTAYAVYFAPSANSRLVISSSASFGGGIQLNGGALELAAGGRAGTIAGSFLAAADAGTITVDSHAAWQITGAFTDAFTPIVNNGTIIAGPSTQLTLDAPLSGTGVIKIGAAALAIGGPVAAGQTIAFTATNETLNLTTPAQFGGKIAGFATGDTILLAGTVTAETFAAGTLTLTEGGKNFALTFASAGSLSHDTFVLTPENTQTALTLTAPQKMAIQAPAAQPASQSATIPVATPAYTTNILTNAAPLTGFTTITQAAAPIFITHTPTTTPLLALHA
jgi:hypothetical protein